ncbi:MAG TPA: FAD-dependent oxidoreductase [Candidatus Latescibacteria bacterium]|nr:FAD-dependent oxidoreductase [Candidatus Latescibacterota bacterium]HOF61406.1 FAD-dependent oxidoreductase [Candidatus Latescibacterota bacterium]HOS64011.1 FAD-dependent oxidoreductase [Candidatus Latescibacterota bacterium]HPK74866.1 FAD-dependent oxidoreductase [Candidatus Latescibacterota bacterium]
MLTITEPSRTVPIVHEADVCVIGGSCTGVFAAVRAARLGASVAIVELGGFFGGVATAGLVNVWHSLKDVHDERQIIGGLTQETIDRLHRRAAVEFGTSPHAAYFLNTEELKIELDTLITDANVRPFLHARFVAPVVAGGRLDAVIIEDKSGRRAIRAKYFVDASGDGDLIHRMGLPTRFLGDIQPPTACCIIEGLGKVEEANPGFKLNEAVFNPEFPEALRLGFLWTAWVAGSRDMKMVAGTRVANADCSDADQLTAAEMEGRRQIRAMVDILRNHYARGEEVFLRGVPSYIGIRETRHAQCLHSVTEMELLTGHAFEDTIGCGTYHVDVHHSEKPGLTFRNLDGTEEWVVPGRPPVRGRWRPEGEDTPAFYQFPYRSLVPEGSKNVLVAGRLIDCDCGAYGALRVMVNCNQTGEAAGVASALALRENGAVADVNSAKLRDAMREGGSLL